jgi:SulP family sulfate permease
LIGALFGGSKYQVYGPTAALIPVVGGLMAIYDHGFLVLASIIAGVLLMMIGVARLGRIVAMVPHSIVVGFTIGIAVVIAFSQAGEVMGIDEKVGYQLHEQIAVLARNVSDINVFAIIVALVTFAVCKLLIRVSTFIPAPLIGLLFGYVAAATFWRDKGLVLIEDRYGSIPTDFWVITPPTLPSGWTFAMAWDLLYFVLAIFFVAAVESLLCSRMADRMASNTGKPFNPNKELWGQGLVNIFTPLLNGFPHTGALARTAVNIRLGALSPLAGIAKFFFKLLLAAFLATYLEQVPMACVGGILMYVASGMVKTHEIKEVLSFKNPYHTGLMVYTAVMVPLTGFMTGVLSALVIYVVLSAMVRSRVEIAQPASAQSGASS